jgi:hypothetical protein
MVEIADVLESLRDKEVFFHFDSDFIDWTRNDPAKLVIYSNKQKSIIELNNGKDIESIAASFYFYTKNSKLISWNSKNLFSYFKKKSSIQVNSNIIYDLNVLCSYFSLPKKKPNSLKEANFLIDFIKNTDRWENFEIFYDQIYWPLISKVIPSIETNGLVDTINKKIVYSYYELEGQANGRMKTLKNLRDSFMPHSMGEKDKESIKLKSDTDFFVSFDFKHMEVSTLAWITKDPALLKIVNSNIDLYKSIWFNLTKQEANKEQRNICKNIFLPVLFGQKAYSLSQRLGISENSAEKLIYKLRTTFPVAFSWVDSQEVDSNNFAVDIFGRRRKFESEHYKIKNFSIQSPSNMICLRKLVKLHEAIKDKAKLCIHVHDGYILSCDKNKLKDVYSTAKEVLEENDSMFPDLKLKVSCKFGSNLNNLNNIKEKIKV